MSVEWPVKDGVARVGCRLCDTMSNGVAETLSIRSDGCKAPRLGLSEWSDGDV